MSDDKPHLEFGDAAALLPSANGPVNPLSATAPPPAAVPRTEASSTAPRPSAASAPEYEAAFALAAAALPEQQQAVNPGYRLDIDALKPVYVDEEAPRVRDDGRGFDASIGYILSMPLRGPGLLYYVLFGGGLVFATLLVMIGGFLGHVPFLNIIAFVGKLLGALALGATVSLAQRMVTIGLYASIQGLEELPFEGKVQLSALDGVVLLFVLLVFYVPARAVETVVMPPFGTLLSALLLAVPAYVWPALMLVTCKSDAPMAAFDVGAVRRCIEQCGRRYPKLVGLVWAAAAAGWLVWFGLGYIMPDSLLGYLICAVLAGAPIGWAHAVLGAAFGRLIRDTPAIGLPEIVFVEEPLADQGADVAGIPPSS